MAVMEKMLLVTEVALLCRYQAAATENADFFPSQTMDLDTPEQSLNGNGSDDVLRNEPSTRLGIMDLLEHWEEPQRAVQDEMVRLASVEHAFPVAIDISNAS
jgi:hypothetical protein